MEKVIRTAFSEVASLEQEKNPISVVSITVGK